MNRRHLKNGLHNRPSLLLWLLPFVLLNFAGEALHNHPVVSGVALSQAAPERADVQNKHPRENARLDVACLACQWHSFSAGTLDARAAFAAPRAAATLRVLAAAFTRPPAVVALSTRGPPFSFA